MAFFNFSQWFSFGSASSFISIIIWGLMIIIPLIIIGILIRNKLKYVYYGEVFKKRQGNDYTKIPEPKTLKGKAGYFNKRGKTVFRIKFGMMPWQQIELTKLPDPTYMIDNKVYYLQLNKDNYVQAEMKIDWEGKSRNLSLEPVEDDLKYGAKLDLAEKDKILNPKSTLEKIAPFVVLGLIIFAGIITMYFIQKGCQA